jgi:hypothetical protein
VFTSIKNQIQENLLKHWARDETSLAYFLILAIYLKVVILMAQRNSGTQSGNYKIPNKSGAFIKAPNSIQKDSVSPKKSKGGDLRSK